MKCIIIDDDELYCVQLSAFCERLEMELLGTFNDPIKATQFITAHPEIELIFLDIHMPDLSGFDILRNYNPNANVVITSSDETKALEAFDFNVVDYLVKPVTLDKFMRAVNRAKPAVNSPAETPNIQTSNEEFAGEIFVNVNKRLVKIEVDDICLIEAKGDYILIKLEKGENQIVHTTLKKITPKLDPDQFIRVHRSFIINTKKIVDIQDSSVLIQKDVIPISKTYKEPFFQKINLI